MNVVTPEAVKGFVADFIRLKMTFIIKRRNNRFLSHPLLDRFVGKPVVVFLFVVIELFSLSVETS